jgi:WD40 repeat protein
MKKMHRVLRDAYDKLAMKCVNAGCAETFPWPQQSKHEAVCAFAPKIECQYCKESINLPMLEEHHKVACSMFPVVCTVGGCGKKVGRSQMKEHFRDFAEEHVHILQRALVERDSLVNQLISANEEKDKCHAEERQRLMMQIADLERDNLALRSELKSNPGGPFEVIGGGGVIKPRSHETKLSHGASLDGHTDTVSAVVVSRNDHRLFSGSLDNTIKVWDIRTNTCIRTLSGHEGAIYCLVLYEHRQRLYSASADGTIKVWITRTFASCEGTLTGHEGDVIALLLDEQTNRLYSTSRDHTIKVWDLNRQVCVSSLREHTDTVFALALCPRTKRLYSGDGDNMIKVWDTVSLTCLETILAHDNRVFALCLSEDGSRLYSGSGDDTIKVWDTATHRCLHTLDCEGTAVIAMSMSHKTNQLISGSLAGHIKVWDMTSFECVATMDDAHDSDMVSALFLAEDSKVLYSGSGHSLFVSSDNSVKVWQLDDC